MGFIDFWKKVFSSEEDDAELKAARARHGIKVETPEEQKKREKAEEEAYDPWEVVRNVRTSFFFGSWASRKFRIVGEDKVKAELEALEKKRKEEEEAQKQEKG
jgi:uncharacterized caspase-like protein